VILEQTASAIDLLKEQVRTVGNALIEEDMVVASLRADDIDRVLEYRTNLVFTTFRAVYPFIRFVGLYNGATDRYVSTEGLTADVERAFIRRIAATPTMEFFTSYVRPIDYTYPRPGDSGRVVSFVLRPDIRLNRSNESFLLVNVEIDYLTTLVEDLSGGYGGHVLVTTDDGTVVVGSGDPLFANEEFIRAIYERRDTSGVTTDSHEVRYGGTRYIVTSTVAPELGWRLFGIRSRTDILSHSLALAWVTLAVASVIIIVGAVISAGFTNRIYDPLSRLVEQVERSQAHKGRPASYGMPVNEYEVLGRAYRQFASRVGLLEGALHEEMPTLCRSYLHSLLIGTKPELPESEEFASKVVASTQADTYAVLLCRPDRMRDLQSNTSSEELSNTLLVTSRVCHDALTDLGTVTPMLLDGYEIAIVVGGGASINTGAVEERLREAQVVLARRADLTMSCGISRIVVGHEELHEALNEARRSLRNSFFTGPSSVIGPASEPTRTTQFVPFASRLTRRLVEALRMIRRDEVRLLLAEFGQTVRRNSYYGALALYYQLSVELLSEFEALTSAAAADFARHRGFAESLSEIEFATDADREIDSLCETILRVQSSEMADKSLVLYRMACDLVNARYADPALCLDSIADELHVSSGHLGRVFAEHAGAYLSDYISRVRIDHAKALLSTSSMNVSDVAESVGLTNATYFFTLFKRHVGITPASFRRSAAGKP
jgi:AraC-like DNA-binding protein